MIILLIGLLLIVIVAIFAIQNTASITVVFLAWQFHGPLTFILLAALASGLLISSLLSLPDTFQQGLKIIKLKNKNSELKDKLVTKEVEVEEEKSKLDATNAYIDDMQKPPRKF